MTENSKLKRCFVVCPIGAAGSPTRAHADWLFQEVIAHVFAMHFPDQFDVIRADKIDTPGMIDAQIIDHLLDDELVIADMSELNPNAFYELGIRHMKELPVIHMFKKGTEIPFDVKLYRAIPFSFDHPSDLTEARLALKSALEVVLSDNYKIDNPVVRARGIVKLSETSSPETNILQAEIDELNSRISALEGNPAFKGSSTRRKSSVTINNPSQLDRQQLDQLLFAVHSYLNKRVLGWRIGSNTIELDIANYTQSDLDAILRVATDFKVDLSPVAIA